MLRNLTRLFRSQITSRTNGVTHICKNFFTHFTKKELFEKHIAYCSTNETVAVKMQVRNTTLKFKNHYKQLPIPFEVYVDFECFTKPLFTCNPTLIILTLPVIKNTNRAVFVFSRKGLDGINKQFNPIIHTKQSDDEDIASVFVLKLVALTNKIYKDYYKQPKALKRTKQEREEFNKAEICPTCNEELYEDNSTAKILRVRDHCHFTGKYRGAQSSMSKTNVTSSHISQSGL